jgi:hypothetical protein
MTRFEIVLDIIIPTIAFVVMVEWMLNSGLLRI